MADDNKFGKLNPGQIEALQSAIAVLKGNSSLLTRAIHGEAVQDFVVRETPGSQQERDEENATLKLRNLASSGKGTKSSEAVKASIEQAKVHVSLDVQQHNVKIEIETPFGLFEHPTRTRDVKRNYVVAHMDGKGELQDTPKVDARSMVQSRGQKR